MKLLCFIPFALILTSAWTHPNITFSKNDPEPKNKIKKENRNLQLLRNIPWADPVLLKKVQGC